MVYYKRNSSCLWSCAILDKVHGGGIFFGEAEHYAIKKCLFLILFISLYTGSFSQMRKTISLNNGWQTVLIDSIFNNNSIGDSKIFKEIKRIDIPHNWDDYYGYRRLLHGNLHASALYKKSFSVTKQKGKRYFLFFEGVGSYATVWINNKKTGSHAGGRTTFTIDITDAINTTGQNSLLVRADHPAGIKDLPWVCGGCSDERGFSEGSQPLGIFRPVSLIITNEVRIEPFGIHAWADVQPDKASLNIHTTIKNYGTSGKKIQLIHQLIDRGGIVRAVAVLQKSLNPHDSIIISKTNVVVHQPELWSAENPYLYKIKTTIKDDNQIVDELYTMFGFRTIQWKAASHQFLLNGKPVFINGVAEYEHLIGQSHAFSNEQVLSRIKWLGAAGFNAFRDGHQPHNLLYGKYLNERGILWWTQLSAHIWFDTPEFRENFKKLLREWVIERRNDPAIILWGLQNESKLPKSFAEECTQLIRCLDPTASTQRLVTTCNGGEGTDWDVPQNWTGTYGGDPDTYNEDLKKQILVGEYGAWRTLDLHTEGSFVQNGPLSEGRMALLMEKKIRLAETVKDSSAGHFFWLLTSHDNPGRVQGGEGFREFDRIGPVNYKGALTSWEEPTDLFYMYRSNYTSKQKSPMVYIASHTWPNRWLQPGIKDSVIVYSNCDEVELFNDIDNLSFGKKKHGGIGTHFQWDKINVLYNILYAVGYVNGKAVAKDTIVLFHLPSSPHFNDLYKNATNILKPQLNYNYIYRINCGGPDYKDINGNLWEADKPIFVGLPSLNNFKQAGSSSWCAFFEGMPAAFASQRRVFSPIRKTKDWPLFQTFRYGRHLLNYKFPLPDGEYLVELYFAEPWLGIGGSTDAKGMRVFDVSINGKTVLKDFDIWKEAGSNCAVKKMIGTKITGGTMLIEFPQTKAGQAIIAAIAVATKKSGIQKTQALNNIFNLQCNECKLQSWSDIGNKQYANAHIQINNLPSNLFGAEWLQFNKGENMNVIFTVRSESDVFIGVNTAGNPVWLNDYENTGTSIVTNENGRMLYNVYRKRFLQGSTVEIKAGGTAMIFVMPASNMQPAYDLKPVTSYKADVAIMSSGVAKEMIANSNRSIVKINGTAQIEWPVKTGVADIYSLSVKYYWPFEKDVNGLLELIDAGGNMLVSEEISLKFTREGKWNLATINTASMINAGQYTVRLKLKDAKDLVVSNVDIQ